MLKHFIKTEKNFGETKIKRKVIFFTFCTQGGVTLNLNMTHFTWSRWIDLDNAQDVTATMFLLFWIILCLLQSTKHPQSSKIIFDQIRVKFERWTTSLFSSFTKFLFYEGQVEQFLTPLMVSFFDKKYHKSRKSNHFNQ